MTQLCAALQKGGLLNGGTSDVCNKPWVVHCQHAGSGQKVLDYLGRYVFRIAITNNRLERIQDGQVRFRYRDHRTQHLQHCTLSGVEFLQRFLQHVLPRGCTKVRYYGIFSPHNRASLDRARLFTPACLLTPPASSEPVPSPIERPRCPYCRAGNLVIVETLPRMRSP